MNSEATIKVAALPGDGIGAEVMAAALPLFEVLELPIDIKQADIGWQCWQSQGCAIPESTWNVINQANAILLGATTSLPMQEAEEALPKVMQGKNKQYISPIIQLRHSLDLFANVRPCISYDDSHTSLNFTIIRENTEGLYAGLDFYPLPKALKSLINTKTSWRELEETQASAAIRLQTQPGLKRLYQFSFNYAKLHGFKKVTLADKPNVLRHSGAFARNIFEEVAGDFPDIEVEILNVDAIALWMVRNPGRFGVIVAENMFGDILSDLGAGLIGGLGLAASANIGLNQAFFEPVHGSGLSMEKGTANPCAMFLSIAMMMNYLGEHQCANIIDQAVFKVIKEGRIITYDLGGKASTQQMAKEVINTVRRLK